VIKRKVRRIHLELLQHSILLSHTAQASDEEGLRPFSHHSWYKKVDEASVAFSIGFSMYAVFLATSAI